MRTLKLAPIFRRVGNFRPRKVTVKYLDKDGMIVRNDFEGLWATSVQHQIDHLNGVMYFDRLSAVKRDMLIRKAKKDDENSIFGVSVFFNSNTRKINRSWA